MCGTPIKGYAKQYLFSWFSQKERKDALVYFEYS